MGGLALHEGKLAEMATGEGKTLVATLPCYLNALGGEGTVLVVTANDYLARRDSETMGQARGTEWLRGAIDMLPAEAAKVPSSSLTI